MDQECWREEALCYCPGKMLDIRTHMPGFRLMLQDDKGQYPHSGCALIFEGSMLVYDPQWDIAQWVPIWGMSATLTMLELHAANDLNNMVPSPSSEVEAAKPLSPEIMKGILGGTESDTNSLVIDSGDEWDKTEGVGVFSCCSTPTTKSSLTFQLQFSVFFNNTFHRIISVTAQEEEMVRNQALTWEEIVSTQLAGDAENWDAEDSQSVVKPQFEDAP